MSATANNLGGFVKHLRTRVAARDLDRLSDQDLVRHYVAHKDEAAFSCLVKRHGPMVLGICRKMLRHEQDAEDAFQATFLVLARKAHAIRKRAAVGGWIYSVAFRVANKLRAAQGRRRTRENALSDAVPAGGCDDVTWREVEQAVYAELDRLAEKYRAPLVLCYLQGKTRDEAAQQLGCGIGVLRGRLDRGREMLRARLTRRGLTLSSALLAVGLGENASAALLSPSLVLSTIKAALAARTTLATASVSAQAVALTQGVLQAMFLTKLKSVAVGVLAVALVSTGIVSYQTSAQEPGSRPVQGTRRSAEPAAQAKDEMDPGKLRLEIERLRLELEKTRLELVRARLEIELLKTRAEAERIKALRLAEEAKQFLNLGQEIVFDRDNKKGASGLPAGKGPVFGARPEATSPDGKRLARAHGKTIDLLDRETGKQLARSQGHAARIKTLAFSPDGKLLATGGDASISLWDTATLKELRRFKLPGPVSSIRFSPDGESITAIERDGRQRRFDIETGKELSAAEPPARH